MERVSLCVVARRSESLGLPSVASITLHGDGCASSCLMAPRMILVRKMSNGGC